MKSERRGDEIQISRLGIAFGVLIAVVVILVEVVW